MDSGAAKHFVPHAPAELVDAQRHGEVGMGKDRLAAFSDGVIAHPDHHHGVCWSLIWLIPDRRIENAVDKR